jgi:DNA-binding PadR family transcriptional regulator
MGHIVYAFNSTTVGQEKYEMKADMKKVQTKLMKGLLDLILLNLLKNQPMHGYQIITCIRKNFGVYFGPSTIYPLLNMLEEKGYIKSEWDLSRDRPRKVYSLTAEGISLLAFTEDSLAFICRKINSLGSNKLLLPGNIIKSVCSVKKVGES